MKYITRNLEKVVSQVTTEYPVLIDEVQYAPELFTYIKMQLNIHRNGKCLLT